jgi:ADP-ribose pyrophosphatase YjhB (NUDIX family)
MSLHSTARFTMLVATHLLLVKNKQVLLIRRFQTGYEDGNYSLSAGHVEAGESVLAATIRETQEEIGVIIQKEDLSLAHVMHRQSDRTSIDFFFWCHQWQGEVCIAEPDKCDQILWCDFNQLPENTIPYVRQAFQYTLNEEQYSEFGL